MQDVWIHVYIYIYPSACWTERKFCLVIHRLRRILVQRPLLQLECPVELMKRRLYVNDYGVKQRGRRCRSIIPDSPADRTYYANHVTFCSDIFISRVNKYVLNRICIYIYSQSKTISVKYISSPGLFFM